MKRFLSPSWPLGLLWPLLWANAAQAVPCQNNLPPSNPDAVYADHGDGTVTDTRTGLMWKQCAEGLSGTTCEIGSAHAFSWATASVHAEASSFATYSDWRLPNVKELRTLVEECRVVPSININFFPKTPSFYFWSSSPSMNFDSAWGVYFGHGDANDLGRGVGFHVRLVRGGH